MKKKIALALCLVFALSMTACAAPESPSESASSGSTASESSTAESSTAESSKPEISSDDAVIIVKATEALYNGPTEEYLKFEEAAAIPDEETLSDEEIAERKEAVYPQFEALYAAYFTPETIEALYGSLAVSPLRYAAEKNVTLTCGELTLDALNDGRYTFKTTLTLGETEIAIAGSAAVTDGKVSEFRLTKSAETRLSRALV